jgi:MYXO-CTERM domain-containing protein
LIITNSQGPIDVNWMKIRTANDAVERDPTSYELYGTNSPIQSQQNSDGLGGEAWTLISSGPLSLPDARFTDGPVVAINSPQNYQSYKLIFPTVKNATTANSMQIADVQFGTTLSQVPEPSTMMIAAMGLALVAAARRRRG